MSWLFGVRTKHQQPLDAKTLSRFHDRPLRVYRSNDTYLTVGGIDETCHVHFPTDADDPGWVVLGTGLDRKHHQVTILTKDDWRTKLASSVGDVHSSLEMLDGHFVIIRWTPGELSFRCDQLGQRTLYFAETEKEIFFSTRLDWLAQATGRCEIDLEARGSKWLTYNQLAYDSCVRGIERIGPAGWALFTSDGTTRTGSSMWSPEFSGGRPEEATEILEHLVDCAVSQLQKASLGLSGGMDSRFLLAVLTRRGNREFSVHSFGDPADPDVAIAIELSRLLGIEHTLFNDPLPPVEDSLGHIKTYVAQTQLVEPAASGIRLGYYDRLHADGKIMIDGGFGELSRRQYLNRLATFGHKALERGDVQGVLSHLRVPRGKIFHPEVLASLERGAKNALHGLLDAMPPVADIGIGNFVDLLAVRTRVPNFGAPEQARLDCMLLNFMPLVQPSFLRAAFAFDLRHRKNSRLQKRYISRHAQALTRFPLVKGGTTYRFGLPLTLVHAVTLTKKKLGGCFLDRSINVFLNDAEEFIRDLVESSHAANCPLYDLVAIREAVNGYYSGVPGHASTVHWWLTFELWRNSLRKGGN
jgi:hypothetical protein